MVDAFAAAQAYLWRDSADVYVHRRVRAASTGRDVDEEVKKYAGIPCRISFESLSGVNSANGAPMIAQSVKLFYSREYDIPPGCRIDVTRGGVCKSYRRAGEPAMYTHHFELMLEPLERYA